MSTLRTIAKRGLVQVVAGIAPLTWRWRVPGSLAVLMYHRVLPADSPARQTEQPGMYVSPQTLDLHLQELKRHFEFVHLDDWLHRANEGAPLPRLACAITFDDGWRDNFEFALPMLRKHAAPAMVFLVSSYIGTNQRFWPNRLIGLLRKSFSEPESVVFPQALKAIVEPVLAEARGRGELSSDDVDQAVQTAKYFDTERVGDLICAAEGSCGEMNAMREILNGEEVAQMAGSGLVRFGCHTASHLRLGGSISPQRLKREIVLSRGQLRDMCGQSIDVFCYPNGETSAAAIDLARQHYLGAVTTRKGWHAPSSDPHLVRRIGMHEDISDRAESFLARVSAWL